MKHRSFRVIQLLLLILLISCGGGSNNSNNTQTPAANLIPIVNAGSDQNVNEGDLVTLSGTVSDNDGTVASILWTQTGGETVTLLSLTNLVTSFTAPEVASAANLTFQLTVTDNQGVSASDNLVVAVNQLITTSVFQLNDTGITTCSNGFAISLNCPVSGYAGQDAEHGRDALVANGSIIKVGDGKAGFDFTKLDDQGDEQLSSSQIWSCVQDNVTGLIWESKTTDGGLRDMNHSYTWYNTDNTNNGGQAGLQNGGLCSGSDCDTSGFVTAVNSIGICGTNNWRMPTREELRSLVDYSEIFPNPLIDTDFFPNTRSTRFWSSSVHSFDSFSAWYMSFSSPQSKGLPKNAGHAVRLVTERN